MIVHLPSGRAVPGTLRGLGQEERKPLYKRWWMLPVRIPLLPFEIPYRATRATYRGAKALAKKIPAAVPKGARLIRTHVVPGIERLEEYEREFRRIQKQMKRGKSAGAEKWPPEPHHIPDPAVLPPAPPIPPPRGRPAEKRDLDF